MALLILGLVIFFGTHAFTMAREHRARAIARLGEGGYKGLYSLLSFGGLALVWIGYGGYRFTGYIPVWTPPVWTMHLAILLVWPAFVMVAAAYLPGRIKATLKHPMLIGVKVWAVAHLIANGDLGSIVLFGSFLAYAVVALMAVKRRDVAAQHGGPAAAPAGGRNDLIALALGTVVYLLFLFWLHPLLIGVSPLPGR